MWNELKTDAYEGMLAETITMQGYNGDRIRAYFSRPLGEGPYPGIVLIPHMPGWDEINREVARRFTQHGYLTVCPNIYERFGHGQPAEIAVKAREAGGVPEDSVMGDCEGALNYLNSQPYSNGNTGVIGMCSGGRHAFLAGCRVEGFSAVVDCWGGGLSADMAGQLNCPLLGIFGNDDKYPTPEQVDGLEEELKKHGKDYSFHRYDGAGHGFWSYNSEMYRPLQAMDSWEKVFSFFEGRLRSKP